MENIDENEHLLLVLNCWQSIFANDTGLSLYFLWKHLWSGNSKFTVVKLLRLKCYELHIAASAGKFCG